MAIYKKTILSSRIVSCLIDILDYYSLSKEPDLATVFEYP